MKSRLNVVSVAALCLIGLAGCRASDPAREQLSQIRHRPTPELQTLTQTPDEVDNQIAITFATNDRSLKRDLGILFLTDRPSRLSPYPMR